jgi:hypothetical protein
MHHDQDNRPVSMPGLWKQRMEQNFLEEVIFVFNFLSIRIKYKRIYLLIEICTVLCLSKN